MTRKVIVGLHGLSNKPPEDVLRDWWRKALTDGVHFLDHVSAPTPPERQAILPPEDRRFLDGEL